MLISKNIMQNKIHYFKTLDTLKILKFWEIASSNNYHLLDIDYLEDKKYSQEQSKELENAWFRIYDEYFVLRDNSVSKSELSKSFDALVLQSKILNLSYALNALSDLKQIQGYISQEEILSKRKALYAPLLKLHPKIKYQLFNSVDLDIDYILKFKNSLQNSYNFNFKSEKTVNKEQVKNVYDTVAIIESWLERSLPIDDISVSRWLAYESQVIKKQKAQSNGK